MTEDSNTTKARRWTYDNDLSSLNTLAKDLKQFWQQNQIDPEILPVFNLCLDEVLTNIIFYAFEGVKIHPITIALQLSSDYVEARIQDRGRPFNPLKEVPLPTLATEVEKREVGGLGIFLLRNIMDTLHYERKNECNILVMKKRLAHSTAT